MIPVVFFHRGEQDYFQAAINIASKKNKIIVIGNQSEKFRNNNTNVLFFNELDYKQDDSLFRSAYKHMHSGDPEAQIICYTRWFIIRNLIKSLNIEAFFHADSDLAVLVDVEEYYKNINRPNIALSTQDYQENFRFVASGHNSFFTIQSLEELCEFMLKSYDASSETYQKLLEKHAWHLRTNTGGGVCDMTQLYLYSITKSTFSLTKIHNDSCFDDNINSSENYYKNEYKMKDNLKLTRFIDNNFYFENNDGKLIKANSIHCQGQSKSILFKIQEILK
jgi:hypothetical protein